MAYRRVLGVFILVAVVFGSLGYSVSAYPQLRSWMMTGAAPVSVLDVFDAPSGINGSVAFERGLVSCSVPFPDPQGSVLIQGPDREIVQVSVKWTFNSCDLNVGVFQALVHPGRYRVSFTGFPLTLPANGARCGTNLPLNIRVQAHQLTQVFIVINYSDVRGCTE